MKCNLAAVIMLLLALSACDSKQSSEDPAGAIPQSQLQALEKAQDVEGLLDDSYEKRKDAADEY